MILRFLNYLMGLMWLFNGSNEYINSIETGQLFKYSALATLGIKTLSLVFITLGLYILVYTITKHIKYIKEET